MRSLWSGVAWTGGLALALALAWPGALLAADPEPVLSFQPADADTEAEPDAAEAGAGEATDGMDTSAEDGVTEDGTREDGAAVDGDAPVGAEIVISEDEAHACAARLEPMVESFEEPRDDIYLRRVEGPAFQVWAPREDTPGAPFRPWCVTTLEAIRGVTFLNPTTQLMVMDLAAAASSDPPPDRVAPEVVPEPPPTVVLEEIEEEEPRGLPAAYQRTPLKGGRSAAQVGVPIRADMLPIEARGLVAACGESGGQATAVFDRITGNPLGVECRAPDGSAAPMTALAAYLTPPKTTAAGE